MYKPVIILVSVITLFSYVYANEKVIICYYGSWATYRPDLGQFNVENIHPDLCSHIVYSFVGIRNGGTVTFLDPNLDLGRDNIVKFNALKRKNPKLKTILAVGGWSEGSAQYSIMAQNPNLRRNFINTATKTVLKYGFDGFDIDWEYPNRRDSVHGRADVDNFVQLLKELREEFNKYGLLLTAAVSSAQSAASLSYNILGISKYLDLIGLMTYDFHGAWNSVTGHNAGLYPGLGDKHIATEHLLTVDAAVQYWLNQGCPPEKMVLGLPFYGRTFTLADPRVSSVRAPSVGAGLAGPYTREHGIIGYNEICVKLQSERWDVRWSAEEKVPYAVKGRDWVTYDNVASLKQKVEYGKKHGLAGVLIWSIETDDFHGLCHGEDFPLLRGVNRALGRNVEDNFTITTSAPMESTTPATEPPTPTSTTAATSEPVSNVCRREGLAANPEDCATFFMCTTDVNGNFVTQTFSCPHDLLFDGTSLACNYPELVECAS